MILYKTKPPRSSVAAIFLSGPTIFQALKGIDGIIWTDFTFFPGLSLASSRFFRDLDSKLFFGFGWRFITPVFWIPDQDFRWIKGFLAGFHGM
jgi:hypothetical protein